MRNSGLLICYLLNRLGTLIAKRLFRLYCIEIWSEVFEYAPQYGALIGALKCQISDSLLRPYPTG